MISCQVFSKLIIIITHSGIIGENSELLSWQKDIAIIESNVGENIYFI